MRKVWAHALGTLFRNVGAIVVTMFAPVVLMTAAQRAPLDLVSYRPSTILIHWLVGFLAWLILWVGFASVLHGRFLGLKAAPWRAIIWTRAQVNFLQSILKLIATLIALGFFTVILSFAVPFGALLGMFISTVVWSRNAMVLPAAAVGRPMSLGDSWEFTAPARVRVVFLVGSLYLLAQVLVAALFSWQAINVISFEDTWVSSLISSAIMFTGAAIVAAVLSATYRGLVEMRPPHERDSYLPQDGSHLANVF
ncbi:MAG: hypothetical protein HQ495_16495 [Alphaproteobacteria bacterium]|nr:hypothetical protein [Alphaproteobacteria bacterium]